LSTLLGDARIRVRYDGQGFESEAKSGVLGSVKRIGALAGAALGGAVAIGLKGAIGEASNLEQSMGAVDAVFKDSSGTVKQWAKDAAQASGLSQNQFGELASTLGAMLKNKGIQDFTGQTKNLIDLGGDLAAQFGGSTKEAVEAISSLMRGEADPIERYGVSINETAINAKLAAEGLGDLEGAALEQAKAQARVQLLMDQTTDAQGAFSRESGTAANAQQKLNAAWDNTKASLGKAFLPLLATLADRLTGFLPQIEGMGAQLPGLFDKAKDSVAEFGQSSVWASLKEAFGSIMQAAKELAPVLAVVFGNGILGLVSTLAPLLEGVAKWVAKNTEVTLILAAAWAAVSLAMKASPIGLVIAALAALVAGLKYAWENSETFRNIVTGVWESVQKGASWMWDNVLKPTFEALKAGFEVVSQGVAWAWQNILKPIFDIFASVVTTLWNNVLSPIFNLWWTVFSTVASTMFNIWIGVMKPVFDAVASVASFLWQSVLSPIFSAIGSAWSGLMSGMKWVWDTVLAPVFGFFGDTINGVKSTFDTAVEGIGTAWEGLKSLVATPIKWVIDTVWNNGLLAAWNWINDLWDGKDVAEFDVSKISFASGGIMPGYTPGRDVHKFFSPTGGALELSGGEAIMRPEVTKALGADGVNALNAAARSGGSSAVADLLTGMADNQASQKFADGGVWEVPGWVKPLIPDSIENVLEGVANNPVFSTITEIITGSASQLWKFLKEKYDAFAQSVTMDTNVFIDTNEYGLVDSDGTVKMTGGFGGGKFPGNGWEGIWQVVKAAFPEARANSTVRNTNDRHGMGKAIDLGQEGRSGGNGHPYLAAMNRFLHDNYKSDLYELIYDGAGDDRPDLKNGQPLTYSSVTRSQHKNHVHAAVYDRGGVLEPGLTMARNKTGGPEAILTDEQWAKVYAAAENDGPLVDTINIYPQSTDARGIVDEITFELRKVKRGAHV
jgi:hypothetical protein